MKSIDEYKKEILLKVMNEEGLSYKYIKDLPKDDSLRTFICELGSLYAFWYAYYVDKAYLLPPDDYSWNETRTSACKDPEHAYWYAVEVDGAPNDETREASYKNLEWAFNYRRWEISLDKSPIDGYIEN
jgi:hypothetical protein